MIVEYRFDLKRFKVGNKLGEGGYSVVVKAFDREEKKDVALKIFLLQNEYDFDGCDLEYFVHEADCLERLNHPSIIGFNGLHYSVTSGPGLTAVPYLSLEYFDGTSLDRFIENMEGARLEKNEKLGIILETARVLEYSHSQKVWHLDIKPANILYDGKEIRVIDWSLSRLVGGDNPEKPEFFVFGTPGFIPPEACLHGEDAKSSSDVYSLGVMGYCLLLNKNNPFNHHYSSGEMIRNTSRGLFGHLKFSRIKNKPLREIISAMMEYFPGNRPAMGEVIKHLEKIV